MSTRQTLAALAFADATPSVGTVVVALGRGGHRQRATARLRQRCGSRLRRAARSGRSAAGSSTPPRWRVARRVGRRWTATGRCSGSTPTGSATASTWHAPQMPRCRRASPNWSRGPARRGARSGWRSLRRRSPRSCAALSGCRCVTGCWCAASWPTVRPGGPGCWSVICWCGPVRVELIDVDALHDRLGRGRRDAGVGDRPGTEAAVGDGGVRRRRRRAIRQTSGAGCRGRRGPRRPAGRAPATPSGPPAGCGSS